MANILLLSPWNYHDEGVGEYDMAWEWRNAPYALLILAAYLKQQNHTVKIADLGRELMRHRGNLQACLNSLAEEIVLFRPEIIGISFFSVHFIEVQRLVDFCRKRCRRAGLHPLFVAGGLHSTLEPHSTCAQLGFDYAFAGEGELGLAQLAGGTAPACIQGFCTADETWKTRGEVIDNLDAIPFPDWNLVDSGFYSTPTFARVKVRSSQSLDMIMGRGCPYHCSFCAYGALSRVRFHSADYLVDQFRQTTRQYNTKGIYFLDSSIGNNKRLLVEFCERLLQTGVSAGHEWYANIRVDQVDIELLKLMWASGCRYLFYGFESGSQRILDKMHKLIKVADIIRVADIHTGLRFPFHASFIVNYPGETKEDLKLTALLIKRVAAPSTGINWYVPLPGSVDYRRLKAAGEIKVQDPMEWRAVGETNSSKVYADLSCEELMEQIGFMNDLANRHIPAANREHWGEQN